MEHSSTAVARQALFALGTPRTPIVAHRVWTSTLDKALTAIDSGKTVVAILGPEGVGKTTLLHEIAQVSEPAQADGFARRITVLDNADRLGDEFMQRVSEARGGCLLMAGGPELALELSMIGPDAAIISMGRIWQADVPAYLDALCVQTGQAAGLIEPAATERLSAVSSGLPGVLTAVARTAALVAAALGADRVGPAHVDSAARLYARRETLPASPAQLAALLREEGTLPDAPANQPESRPDHLEPRVEAAGWQTRSRPAIRLAAFALGCAILATGAALWFGGATGPQDNTPPAPSREAEPAPSRAEPPQAAVPSPPVPPAQPPVATAPAIAPPSAARPAAGTPPAGEPAPLAGRPPETAPDAVPAPAPPAAPPAVVTAASGNPERVRTVNLGTLPQLAPPRVVVRYAADSAAAQSRAMALTDALRANGFAAPEPAPARADEDRPSIGFFFFEDRGAAAAVEAAIKPFSHQQLGTPGLLALTRTDSLPAPGTIDIFIRRRS